MAFKEEIPALRARITNAQSRRDTWRAAGRQERFLEACSEVAALDLQLEQLRAEGFRSTIMAEFAIRYDGRQYLYKGIGYDRLDDAVACARLLATKTLDT